MNILVTGARGYVGQVVCKYLADKGHNVYGIDTAWRKKIGVLPQAVKMYNTSTQDVEEFFRIGDLDVCIHLSGEIQAGESMKFPDAYWGSNVENSIELFASLRALGCRKIIFASSAAVYGLPEQIPISEEHPTKPVNTYGLTKLSVDNLLTSLAWAGEMESISLRFFNVAGSYEGLGENHERESHIIPLAIRAALSGGEFNLYGTDYGTFDGTCVRDYVHVEDLANAMYLCLDEFENGKHKIYNLGSQNGYSNREVLDAVQSVTKRELKVVEKERREGDPGVLVADSTKARTELNWKPKYNDIESIVQSACEYEKKD